MLHIYIVYVLKDTQSRICVRRHLQWRALEEGHDGSELQKPNILKQKGKQTKPRREGPSQGFILYE